MAGHLLLVIFIDFCHEFKVEALPPPTLTVNPAVITETDSVTLNCQTPTSVSESQCYFYTLSGRTVRTFSCLKTLTGTELLNMAHQKSPAVVEVTCYYTAQNGGLNSPHSNISSIKINTLPPPTLTVNPAVITETDSVTLNCQTSVSVSQCDFYTLSGRTVRTFSCLKTLTGTELLNMARQKSPAVVKLTCSYSVKVGEFSFKSSYSNISSISIQNIVETQTLSTFTMTTGSRVTKTGTTVTLFPVTPVKTASEKRIWTLTVVVAGCGVAVGGILLLLTVLRNRKRAVAHSEERNRRASQNQNTDTYHFYSTISNVPATMVRGCEEYSTVRTH